MPKVWPSSTFTTPSLPTFSIASEMTSPMARSREEIAATRAMSSLPETSLDCLAISATTSVDGRLDAALEAHRVGAGGHVLEALAHDRLGQHGGGGGAIAGDVVGGRGHLAHELGALVLEDVLDLDLAGDGDAVVGDRGGAELLVEHHVAALGAEGHLDRVGQGVDPALERPAGVLVELDQLCHLCARLLRFFRMSVGRAPAGGPGAATSSPSSSRPACALRCASRAPWAWRRRGPGCRAR